MKKLLLEIQATMEDITDHIYNSEDEHNPYRIPTISEIEDIHLELAGLLVPLEEAINEFNNMHEAFGQALDWLAENVADASKEYHEANDERWKNIQPWFAKHF